MPFLRTMPVPNPSYFVDWSSFLGFYDSGIVWYSNGHLQVNILFGSTFFSVLLSSLFGLNLVVLISRFGTRGREKGAGIGALVGAVPALFSGACCAVSFGITLLSLFGSILPSVALITFAYNYVYVINSLAALLMAASLVYSRKKAMKRNPSNASHEGREWCAASSVL